MSIIGLASHFKSFNWWDLPTKTFMHKHNVVIEVCYSITFFARDIQLFSPPHYTSTHIQLTILTKILLHIYQCLSQCFSWVCKARRVRKDFTNHNDSNDSRSHQRAHLFTLRCSHPFSHTRLYSQSYISHNFSFINYIHKKRK